MTDTELLNFLDETPRWEIEKPHNHLVHAVIVRTERKPVAEETIRDAIEAMSESVAKSPDLTAPRESSHSPGFHPADLRKALTDLLPYVYPAGDTQGFDAAVAQAHAALNLPMPSP